MLHTRLNYGGRHQSDCSPGSRHADGWSSQSQSSTFGIPQEAKERVPGRHLSFEQLHGSGCYTFLSCLLSGMKQSRCLGEVPVASALLIPTQNMGHLGSSYSSLPVSLSLKGGPRTCFQSGLAQGASRSSPAFSYLQVFMAADVLLDKNAQNNGAALKNDVEKTISETD